MTWTDCASQGKICEFSGTALVRYGAQNSYFTKTATNKVLCADSVFGDPLPYFGKSCSYSFDQPVAPEEAAWIDCGKENQFCQFSGTANVRYGAEGKFYTQTISDGVQCANSVFGDPLVGVVKGCQYMRVSIAGDSKSIQPAAAAQGSTLAGVQLPPGWTLKRADRFGNGAGGTIGDMSTLHERYFEGQFYNRDGNGRVYIPNVVINDEQQTYEHFEDVIGFSDDHITIQARGHADGSITSGELVSTFTSRSFCVEAKYQIPSARFSWAAFWQYGATSDNDASELDFEQPITENQGVHDVTMHNHPYEGTNVQIANSAFTTPYMNLISASFDGSSAPHSYTSCYDDANANLSRYIDGHLVYSAFYKWNASLGGTNHGADATTILNLAVGGNWQGHVSDTPSFSADMNIYSVLFYAP